MVPRRRLVKFTSAVTILSTLKCLASLQAPLYVGKDSIIRQDNKESDDFNLTAGYFVQIQTALTFIL